MNRKTRGMSLVEVLVGGAILVAIIFTLTAILLDSLQIRQRMEAKTSVQSSARLSLDKISRDASAASHVHASYTNGSFDVNSGPNSLILGLPAFSSSNSDLGADDIVIYRVHGSTIPYTLEKRVYPAPGSQRASSIETLSNSVLLMEATYFVRQPVNCDGVTLQFFLDATPSNTNIQVVLNGTESSLTSANANYNGIDNSVTFDAAPSLGSSVEFLYEVDPQDYADKVSLVELNLGMQRYTINGSGFTKSNQFFSTTRAQLMNN